ARGVCFPPAPEPMRRRRPDASKRRAEQAGGGRPPASVPPSCSRETAMKLPRREFLRVAAAVAALPAATVRASAQSYPTRPVRLILGFPAGGSPDLVPPMLAA